MCPWKVRYWLRIAKYRQSQLGTVLTQRGHKEQDTQYKYRPYVKLRCANNYSRGKAISITYSVVYVGACTCACVRAFSLAYPACKTYVPYCDVICGLWLHNIFRHYLINSMICRKRLLSTKYVFWLSLRLLSKTFLTLKEFSEILS